MTPQPAERRVLIILWLAMAASIAMYFVVIQMVPPTSAHEDPALVNALLVAAAGMVGASFLVKSRIRAAQGERTALLIALALCEAAALCGLVVWFVTAWPYYYVFLLLGLAGQVLHFPGGRDPS
jgi:uncharacterized membrane protein